MSYINNRSEGLMKLAVSASSSVALDTPASAIRFLRGTPVVMAMPAELRFTGGAYQTPMVVISSRPGITVELSEYDVPSASGGPHAMQLHLVPLLDDPDFVALWFGDNGSIAASD